MSDLDEVFERLQRSPFRRKFRLRDAERDYLDRKGLDVVLDHGRIEPEYRLPGKIGVFICFAYFLLAVLADSPGPILGGAGVAVGLGRLAASPGSNGSGNDGIPGRPLHSACQAVSNHIE